MLFMKVNHPSILIGNPFMKLVKCKIDYERNVVDCLMSDGEHRVPIPMVHKIPGPDKHVPVPAVSAKPSEVSGKQISEKEIVEKGVEEHVGEEKKIEEPKKVIKPKKTEEEITKSMQQQVLEASATGITCPKWQEQRRRK